VKDDPPSQLFLAKSSQLRHHLVNRCVRNRNQDHRRKKDVASDRDMGPSAPYRANGSARRGLILRNDRMDFPTAFAKASAEGTADAPRSDNGNAVLSHHVRITADGR
jgi:hypothetical protein